jgi:hypothetical protein
MLTNVDKKDPKSSEKFLCDLCDYRCSKQSLFNRHLLTPKHQKKAEMLTNVDTNVDKKCQKMQKSSDKKYICECGKEYNHRQSLSLHKKKCGHLEEIKKEDIKEEKTDLHHLFLETLKQNQELQKQVIEMSKERNTIIQNQTNNNNSFNLNIFLNEKCKDALNIQDFVDTIKLQLSDLEETGRLGYVEGLTNIVVRGLKELDVYKRPIHCSDLKREILYVKDQDSWTKENEDKGRITKAIKQISVRNAKQINEWTKLNKGYDDSSSKKSDKYLKLIIEANSGEPDEINKIIKHVAKQVTIDKAEK